jgi:AcrR family transcriptional regulator
MTTIRAPRPGTVQKRALLLDVTEQIMVEEGYAAVSSRRVAAKAGMQAPHIHYYFPTLDDLFVGVFRRRADKNLERLATALASPEPLRALWKLSVDSRGTALLNELMAAANHRPALREVVIETSREARQMQAAAISQLLIRYGVDTETFPAELVLDAMQGTALLVVRQQGLGVVQDNTAVIEAVDRLLQHVEEGNLS